MADFVVLVCGGRDFSDRALLNSELDWLNDERPISQLISGAATGADTMSVLWAISRMVAYREFPADWERHGRAAGPIRNQWMLDEGRPSLVVAFPGRVGTVDMVRRAWRAGVPALLVGWTLERPPGRREAGADDQGEAQGALDFG